MRKFRKGAAFTRPEHCTTKLDRNTKAKIIFCAEQRELKSKQPGRKDGVIGQSGLRVLRTLLHQFHNASTGRCDPSYIGIMARSGLCKEAVATGLQKLEAAGVLKIVRRLARDGWRTIQLTNAYLFPAEAPALLPSLLNRQKPTCSESFPYRRPSPLLSVPLSKAFEALAEAMEARMALEGSG